VPARVPREPRLLGAPHGRLPAPGGHHAAPALRAPAPQRVTRPRRAGGSHHAAPALRAPAPQRVTRRRRARGRHHAAPALRAPAPQRVTRPRRAGGRPPCSAGPPRPCASAGDAAAPGEREATTQRRPSAPLRLSGWRGRAGLAGARGLSRASHCREVRLVGLQQARMSPRSAGPPHACALARDGAAPGQPSVRLCGALLWNGERGVRWDCRRAVGGGGRLGWGDAQEGRRTA